VRVRALHPYLVDLRSPRERTWVTSWTRRKRATTQAQISWTRNEQKSSPMLHKWTLISKAERNEILAPYNNGSFLCVNEVFFAVFLVD
jgi:hypothetical protein